jgi:hypothetical protein
MCRRKKGKMTFFFNFKESKDLVPQTSLSPSYIYIGVMSDLKKNMG